jgi:hypothetical protein
MRSRKLAPAAALRDAQLSLLNDPALRQSALLGGIRPAGRVQ